MNPKEFIEQLKDYADVADASYAMLHYVDENENFDKDDDKFRTKIPAFKPIERWIYADGIKLGYKKDNGMPTAYALAIEARFSQNIEIKKFFRDETEKIDNRIQNLIDRDKKDPKAIDQKILVATTKEKQDKDSNFTFHLSPRTKYFTSRFEILHHQPNTSISGYSHTLFKDHLAKDSNDRYILAFRGTELRGAEL